MNLNTIIQGKADKYLKLETLAPKGCKLVSQIRFMIVEFLPSFCRMDRQLKGSWLVFSTINVTTTIALPGLAFDEGFGDAVCGS
jgi:hypothetical protein